MAADRGTETEVEVARGAPECQGPREGKCQDINANKKEWREDDKSCGCSGDEGDAAGGRDRDKTHHHHHQRHHPAGNNHTVRPSKDQDVAKYYRMVPPDGGWGWMVALGTFLIVTLLPPLRPCFGVLFSGYLLAAGSSSTSTAWIFSLMCFLWFISGLFSRPLTQEFGWRPVALSGSAMACVGMTLSAFAPSPAFLFFSFSLLTGFGGGIVTCQCFTILPHYFQRLRGLTNAIMMSGICTGLFVGPPFARYLQDTYGFRGATLILGGVLFNSCIGASFFHPYEWHQKKVPAEEQPEELQVAPLPINSKAKGSPSLTHGLVMSPSALSFVGSTGEPEGDVSLSARASLLGRLEGWKTSASSSRQSSRYNSTLSLSSMDAGAWPRCPWTTSRKGPQEGKEGTAGQPSRQSHQIHHKGYGRAQVPSCVHHLLRRHYVH
ncbi:Monocarboxylate transporter 2 [Chionoecetes opilio]|uniref:Monocarboxylate transporter 2 n=1 Tax=Chionoecetes opilio TaxID=41210 RepID=A0A8J4XXW5_CHIOP|nr:Monocarboxylate transporter 2 [Chionoecetes opilio]